MDRKYSFAALLAVVGVSIIFGMILGGQLNAPGGMFAARESLVLSQAPLISSADVPRDFSEIAQAAIPAVVSVTNTAVIKPGEGDDRNPHNFRDDPMFWWFFGPPDDDDTPNRRREPQPERQQSFGSGFIISKDGYILTNNHVVEGATRLRIELQNGDRFDGKVIGTDPSIDMALVKIDGDGRTFPMLPLGDSDALRVGEWVVAIGNPLNLQSTVTAGVVSAKGRRVPIGGTDAGVANFIQTDAAINRGNSGGPLLDMHGRVVGMNTAILRGGGVGFGFANSMAEGIGFALPINDARSSVEQIMESGSVQRGYLGIIMNQDRINESAREYYDLPDTQGVIVQEVLEGEAADKAGMQPGDIIRKVDGDVIRDNMDLVTRIAHRRPGEKVRIEVFREGRARTLTVTLGERDSDRIAGRTREQERPRRDDDEEEVEQAENLGIKVENLGTQWRRQLGVDASVRGVVVVDVDVASAAADEGIGTGTILTHVNKTPVRSVSDWEDAFEGLRPGAPVRLGLREGENSRSVFLRAPSR